MRSDTPKKLSRWFGHLTRRITVAALAALACVAAPTSSYAQDKEVTIAYQQIVDPWVVAIASGSIEKETGYKINWRQFESGAKVATAMASGDVKVGVIGARPATLLDSGQHQPGRSDGRTQRLRHHQAV
jgi:taurine transport system substrate-binding protein